MDEVTAARAIALAQIHLAAIGELARRLGVPPEEIHQALDGRVLDLNRLSSKALEVIASGAVELSDLFEPVENGVDLGALSAEQIEWLGRGETLADVLGHLPESSR